MNPRQRCFVSKRPRRRYRPHGRRAGTKKMPKRFLPFAVGRFECLAAQDHPGFARHARLMPHGDQTH